jgi:membrane protease subunit (stomatin/prohibitin family)
MAQKQIPPLVFVIIGVFVAVASLLLNANTDSNFIIFAIVGGAMALYGLGKFVLTRGEKKEVEHPEHHQVQHNTQIQTPQHQRVQHRIHQQHQQSQQFKFCTHCGARVHAHARFCQNCGAHL